MLRRMIKEEKDLTFVVIYTREPHARQMAFKEIAQPATWEERKALALKAKKELKLDLLFLIDEMGDPSRKLLGDVPNPAILVERDGTIKDKLAWADASELKGLIKAWRPAGIKEPEAPKSDRPAPGLPKSDEAGSGASTSEEPEPRPTSRPRTPEARGTKKPDSKP